MREAPRAGEGRPLIRASRTFSPASRVAASEYGKIVHVGQNMARRSASEVKARWRDIVAEAKERGEVVITNFDRPEVVVLSMDRYDALKRQAAAKDPLAVLRQEFDRQLAPLRERGAAAKLRKAFAATPARLAKAANAAGRSRRRR